MKNSSKKPILAALLSATGLITLLLAFYLSSEKVDPKKLGEPQHFGQFGDYIGGILNPIFGLSTICLLIWSIQIQLNELRLSRKEFSQSTQALKDQAKISRDENARIQIAEMLQNENKKFEELFTQQFNSVRKQVNFDGKSEIINIERVIHCEKIIEHSGPEKSNAVRKIVMDEIKAYNPLLKNKDTEWAEKMSEIIISLEEIRHLTSDIVAVSHVKTIQKKHKENLYNKASRCFKVGIIDGRYMFELTED